VFWPRARLFYTIFGGELGEGAIVVSRDAAALRGAQRIVTLGSACAISFAGPQDALEPLRRLCRWVVEQADVCEVPAGPL
jgi:hypothetical protein